MSKRVNDISEN